MKCRNCPISLRCLAGRLGFIGLCPECGITTLADTAGKALRLRCEKRTIQLAKNVDVDPGTGVIISDPIGKTIGVSRCSKCITQDRRAHGWTATNPAEFDAQQIDLDEEEAP